MTVASLNLKSHVFNAHVAEQKPFAKNGKGIYFDIETSNGTYTNCIDAITGAAVGALGWGDEDIKDFFTEGLEKYTYSFPGSVINEDAEALARFYIENSPKGAFISALWTCSGSESNENALKIMRQYQKERGKPSKIKVITRNAGYHGFTLGAMSMGRNFVSDEFKELQIPNIFLKMPRCFPYRDMKEGQTEKEYVQSLLDALEKMIIDEDPETVSCVCVETLPGSSLGTAPPPQGYLKGLRDLCNKYDLLFMLDEVMCGTGRAAPNGGLNCWENFLEPCDAPDIQTVGKTLGSGYVTIAGVLIGPKIMEGFIGGSGLIYGGQTYHSHGLNCHVALKIQEKIKRLGLTKNIFEMGNLLGKKLKEALADNPIIGDVRGIGGFWTMEFIKDKVNKTSFPAELHIGSRFQKIAWNRGISLLCLTCTGAEGETWDIASFAPAYIITEADVDEMVSRAVAAIGDLTKELVAEGQFNPSK